MKPLFPPISLLVLLLVFSGSPLRAQLLPDLRLPPEPTSLVVQGMGGAVGADGTLFNASAFNPALLSRAPYHIEALNLGVNITDDVLGVIDYVRNFNFQADKAFQDLSAGVGANDPGLVSSGLTEVQDVVTHLANQAVEAGAGLNVAVKVTDNLGFQVYNSTHAFVELRQGKLTQILAGIPLPYDSAASGASVSQAVTILRTDLENGIKAVLTSSEQAVVSFHTAALLNGQEDLDSYVSNVKAAVPSADIDLLRQTLIDELINDLAILSALAYMDTVFMGTYSFEPWKDLPLTAGLSLKIVNRHFAYSTLTAPQNAGVLDDLWKDFDQSTTRWGIDLGFLYSWKALDLDVSLSATDLFHEGATLPAGSGSRLVGILTDPAPTVVRCGASWHPIPDLRVNLDLDDLLSATSLYDGDRSFGRFKMGAGYGVLGFLQLRAGFGNNRLGGGLGFLAGFFGLDYSFAADDLSHGYNHYAQMRLVF